MSEQDVEQVNESDALTWQYETVGSGTHVFHATSEESANSIVSNGVQNVANAWGGGRLGSGFYTHTSPESAQLYCQAPEVVVEFETNTELTFAVVPQHIDISQHPEVINIDQFPGLTPAEDLGLELKFHGGDYLTFVDFHRVD